jgi:hypothetical protein
MTGMKSAALQRAYGFEASEHSDYPVVFAGVRDCIDVGTGADGWKRGIGSGPAGKRISDCILPDCQAGFFAQGLQPDSGFQISRGKNDPGHGGRLGAGDCGECLYFR